MGAGIHLHGVEVKTCNKIILDDTIMLNWIKYALIGLKQRLWIINKTQTIWSFNWLNNLSELYNLQ